MPVTFVEQFAGATFTHGPRPSWDIKFEAKGDADRLVIRDEAVLQLAPAYDGMPLQEITITEFGANDEWLVSVSYGPDALFPDTPEIEDPPSTGDSAFTFDTGGGTQHITQNLETSFGTAPGIETVPDFNGAIGVTKSGVAGVDITVPTYQFKETHYLDGTIVDAAYRKSLATLTGQVNAAAFAGFAAGEVLFLGASGSYRVANDDWEITFNFTQSDNRDDIEVGDMAGIIKKGWEYLEVQYEDKVDDAAKRMVVTPTSVIVHQVYRLGDFTALGLGL